MAIKTLKLLFQLILCDFLFVPSRLISRSKSLANQSLLFFNYRWWASRRKVGNKLRSSRIKLNHNMVTGQDFVFSKMQDFLLKCFLYIFLDSSTRVIKNRLVS